MDWEAKFRQWAELPLFVEECVYTKEYRFNGKLANTLRRVNPKEYQRHMDIYREWQTKNPIKGGLI